jgi:hypothetical protein
MKQETANTTIQRRASMLPRSDETCLGALYAVQDKVLAADRNLFQDTTKEHLTHEISSIRQWFLSHESTIQQNRRESSRRSAHDETKAATYLLPSAEERQTVAQHLRMICPNSSTRLPVNTDGEINRFPQPRLHSAQQQATRSSRPQLSTNSSHIRR